MAILQKVICLLRLRHKVLSKKNKGICRHKAQIGDLIYVSSTLGDSAAGLTQILLGKSAVDSDDVFFATTTS